MFLEIPQNSQESTCNFIKKETLAQVFSCEFSEITKNTFFHRTRLVAASVVTKFSLTLNKLGFLKNFLTEFLLQLSNTFQMLLLGIMKECYIKHWKYFTNLSYFVLDLLRYVMYNCLMYDHRSFLAQFIR